MSEQFKQASGKPRVGLVPRAVIEDAAAGLEFGLKKYKKERSYLQLGEYYPFLEAIMRHTLKIFDGEFIDKESGLPHECHIAADISIVCEMKAKGIPYRKEN